MSEEIAQWKTVGIFVLLAFGITWSIALAIALSYHGIISITIPLSLHYILPFGSLLSALIVTWITGRKVGLKDLMKRMTKWRVRPIWAAVAILSVWILYLVSSFIIVLMGQPWPDLSIFGQVLYMPYLTFLGAWLLWIFTYGIGEETGWRGFLLPHLQTRFSALTSSLILGLIWAGWHIPMFLYNENLMAMGLIGTIFWVIGLMFGAVLLTWLYNSTEGSILLTAIWHGTFNLFTAAVGQAAGVASGIISMFVMILVVIIIALYGRENLAHVERQRSE